MVRYKLLDTFPGLIHFCTERNGGVSAGAYASLNLSPFSGDSPENVQENMKRLCDNLGVVPEQLLIPFQTHETEVRSIHSRFCSLSPDEQRDSLHGVDALATNLPEVCICITTADCVPLLFFDPVKKVIGAAHAGWRGTCGRIAQKTILTMCNDFECSPENIHVAIGPSVSPAVYEVGDELIASFDAAGFEIDSLFARRNGALFLDLWAANRQALLAAGVVSEHIETSGICTFTHHERFFSARRLGIKSGRILSGIMLK